MGRHVIQTRMAAAVIAVGVALLLWMMYRESEPGAIPLLLIVVGAGWWLMARGHTRT